MTIAFVKSDESMVPSMSQVSMITMPIFLLFVAWLRIKDIYQSVRANSQYTFSLSSRYYCHILIMLLRHARVWYGIAIVPNPMIHLQHDV